METVQPAGAAARTAALPASGLRLADCASVQRQRSEQRCAAQRLGHREGARIANAGVAQVQGRELACGTLSLVSGVLFFSPAPRPRSGLG